MAVEGSWGRSPRVRGGAAVARLPRDRPAVAVPSPASAFDAPPFASSTPLLYPASPPAGHPCSRGRLPGGGAFPPNTFGADLSQTVQGAALDAASSKGWAP